MSTTLYSIRFRDEDERRIMFILGAMNCKYTSVGLDAGKLTFTEAVRYALKLAYEDLHDDPLVQDFLAGKDVPLAK